MVRTVLAAVVLAFGWVAFGWAASERDRLHYLAINGDGVLQSAKAEEPVNPASVVKLATTLWALDRLGADHRYTTTIGYLGEWDRSTGVLVGDLVIGGGDDPDFQWENAYLVARELNRLGLVRVEGRIRREPVGRTDGPPTHLGLQPEEVDPLPHQHLESALRAAWVGRVPQAEDRGHRRIGFRRRRGSGHRAHPPLESACRRHAAF